MKKAGANCFFRDTFFLINVSKLLINSKKDEREKTHSADKNSTTKAIIYNLDSGDKIGIHCYDWSDNNKNKFVVFSNLISNITSLF